MDAADEDKDVQLQKQSSQLLADFETSLPRFLWKNLRNEEGHSRRIRRRVRRRDTDRLISLVGQFSTFRGTVTDKYQARTVPRITSTPGPAPPNSRPRPRRCFPCLPPSSSHPFLQNLLSTDTAAATSIQSYLPNIV
jgi:hypothetical protein